MVVGVYRLEKFYFTCFDDKTPSNLETSMDVGLRKD